MRLVKQGQLDMLGLILTRLFFEQKMFQIVFFGGNNVKQPEGSTLWELQLVDLASRLRRFQYICYIIYIYIYSFCSGAGLQILVPPISKLDGYRQNPQGEKL